jgi:hypothetical protein
MMPAMKEERHRVMAMGLVSEGEVRNMVSVQSGSCHITRLV